MSHTVFSSLCYLIFVIFMYSPAINIFLGGGLFGTFKADLIMDHFIISLFIRFLTFFNSNKKFYNVCFFGSASIVNNIAYSLPLYVLVNYSCKCVQNINNNP